MQQSLFGVMPPQEEAKSNVSLQPQSLKTPLSEVVFNVLDLETTGLNPKKSAITEVTVIQYQNGQELAKYSTLVKPTELIPDEVEHLTGINNEMVKNAPALVMVLSELAGFMGTAPVVVGHNVSFDVSFLREKFHQSGLGMFVERTDITRALCTKVLAQKLMPGLPGYEGIVVATACGVVNPNPHRAEADVRMSAGILFHLIDKLKTEQPAIQTLGDLLALQGALRG